MGFRVGCEGGWIESGGAYEIERRPRGARSPRRHRSQGRHMAALTVAKGKPSDRHFRYPLRVGSGDTWPEEIPYMFCRQASDCSWKHCHLVFSGR